MTRLVGRWTRVAAMAATVAFAGCGGGASNESGGEIDRSWQPSASDEVKGVPLEAIRAALQQRLDGERPAGVSADQWKHVHTLYAQYAGSALWTEEDGLSEERLQPLAKALVDAHTDGMSLDAYPLDTLNARIQALQSADTPTAEQLASLDVLLSSIYVELGEDLLRGQVNPREVSQAWHIDPREDDIDSALVRTLGSSTLDRSIAAMRPQDEDYQALREQLARYRELAAKGDWPKVPEGKSLKPGDRGEPTRLDALRARLAAEGYVSSGAPTGSNVYDQTLAAAVAQFQARHAIVVDSILGGQTLESLNLPVSFRMGQIAANLERYRWLPRTLGSRYILVNVPAFRLKAFDNGKPALDMKVIVGAEYENRATPVFADSMQYVVFRPYWLVTDSIAANEIFPKAEADPGYLAAHDYELYRENGKVRVRQRPGSENSLGLVKFIFPNDFNIYLHDTPEDRLFDKDIRAFSHGCIRVEKPAQLAQWVLGWPADRVRQEMHSGRDDHRVNLPKKLPVYIVYFTAFMQDGQLHFGNDLYRRDEELVSAMHNGQSSAESVRAAQELLRLTQ